MYISINKIQTILSVIVLCVVFISTPLVFAEGEKTPTYTNEDLKKYRLPVDTSSENAESVKDKSPEDERDEEKAAAKQQRLQDYYCEKGAYYDQKVEDAEDAIKEAQEKYQEQLDKKRITNRGKTGSPSFDKPSEKRVKNAKKKLEKALKKRGDFEQKAYRKGIPSGWLRCQFD
jgi:hypothetical protein